ncbi:MAG: UvrD-helicase domain-containing protein, partial [Nitrospinales bacterium]
MNEEDLKFIETEERLYQKTVDSLAEQLPRVRASKISANLEAREMTRQLTNVRNEEERQALASDEEVAHQVFDIRKENDKALLELLQEPYFGRVVTSEDDGREVSFLVGKKSNIEAGIVDWRNGPLSSLYFNYQQGDEFFEVINNLERSGRIKIRRSYRIVSGKLVQIDTPEGVFLKDEDGCWEKLDTDSQEAASRSRGFHSKEKKLPNILSLITSDQFEMITTDVGKPVIIQGSAGSGKTTVALHRLAWLLHKENSPARPESTRVLMMNKSLQAYVVSTLPSMGIEGVGTLTFNGWAMSLIRQATRGKAFFRYRDLPSFIEEIKFSEEILDVLSAFVERQKRELDRAVRDKFMSQPEIMKIWQGRAPQAIIPGLREVIYDIDISDLRQEVKNTVKSFFRSKLMELEDYVEDMYALFTDSEFLMKNLNGRSKLQSHLKFLRKSTFRNKKDKCLDYFDLPLILRIIQIKNGGLVGKNGEVTLMDHLVIDEAQDFGAVEFAVMINAVRDKSHVTIVGDVGQKILTSRKFIGWDKIIETLEMDKEDLIRLEVSYR